MEFYRNIIIKKVLIIFMVFVVFTGYSQMPDTINTVALSHPKALSVTDIKDITKDGFNFWQDKFNGHFAGIDFGFNTFLNKDYSGYAPELGDFMENDLIRSNSLYVNIIQQSIGLQHNRNTIGLVTGIGLQLQSFRLNQNTTLEPTASGRIVPKTLYFKVNQKSKLSSAYIIVPLLAEWQIPVKNYANRFYVSAGFYGGFWVQSHTKIKYRVEGKKEKLKTPDDFSLTKFKTGLMLRLGYRSVNFFAAYDLNPFFRDNLGPRLNTFTFGLTLVSF